jgi:predicted hotdog family 3-hydroxylacyl-ACP dehydratase
VLQTPDGEPVLTLLDAVLTYDDATVQANAEDASSGASRLRLLGTIVPVVGVLLGLVLTSIGLYLLRAPQGRRLRRPERQSRPADAI